MPVLHRLGPVRAAPCSAMDLAKQRIASTGCAYISATSSICARMLLPSPHLSRVSLLLQSVYD